MFDATGAVRPPAKEIPSAARNHDECDDPRAQQREYWPPLSYGGLGRLRLRRLADFDCIDPNRLGDVLELGRAQIAHGEIEPRLHLPVGIFGQTDSARISYPFKARGDIDAVSHQVAVALLNHVAEVDADAKLDAALGRKPSIALDHAVLHLDGAAHGIDHASELYEDAVAGALHCAAMMRSDGGIDQIAPQPAQSRKSAILIGASKPAVSDHIRRKDRCDFAGLRHGSPFTTRQTSTMAPRPGQVVSPSRSSLSSGNQDAIMDIGGWLRSLGLEGGVGNTGVGLA